MLGALSGFFIQNLFLFDTTSTMLQLALLMAWVAGQERAPADREQRLGAREVLPAAGHPAHESGGPSFPMPAVHWGRWGRLTLTAAIVVLVGQSLYHLTYQPYAASKSMVAAMGAPGTMPMAERLSLAEKSFDTFPPLANLPRAVFFNRLAHQ